VGHPLLAAGVLRSPSEGEEGGEGRDLGLGRGLGAALDLRGVQRGGQGPPAPPGADAGGFQMGTKKGEGRADEENAKRQCKIIIIKNHYSTHF